MTYQLIYIKFEQEAVERNTANSFRLFNYFIWQRCWAQAETIAEDSKKSDISPYSLDRPGNCSYLA